VLEFAGVRVAPSNAVARHPAFDVTPSKYVGGIITEVGVLRPPYEQGLRQAVEAAIASVSHRGPDRVSSIIGS
jgi:methylthioribose-1-phosphate isomerase